MLVVYGLLCMVYVLGLVLYGSWLRVEEEPTKEGASSLLNHTRKVPPLPDSRERDGRIPAGTAASGRVFQGAHPHPGFTQVRLGESLKCTALR